MKLISLKYALKGIILGTKKETNFKVMIVCFALVIAVNLLFSVNSIEWAITILCCGAVLSAELINSAIEKAVDLVTAEKDILAGEAKDMAAGASLVISIASAIVAAIIYLPYLFEYIKEIK
ncbi:MAG: diacylglycerol kinase family protein [Eubacteriales bacterium]